jgi:putative ABC transport system permease protein
MSFLRRLRAGWGAVFGRARVESELEAELRFHLEAHAEDLMRAGLSHGEALRQARVKLGGLERTREECRDALGVSLAESLIQDVRFGLRMLRKNPGFTAVAVITLALGIGANTAIFSVVQSVLLRQLPYEDPNRLVEVWNSYLPRFQRFALSGADFNEWRAQAKSFAQMAAYWSVPADCNLTANGKPARVEITYASSNLLPMLGVRPVAGRGFVAAEDRPGAPHMAMVSHQLWESRFGGDSTVIGRTLTLDGQNYTLIGVLPANFPLVPWADVWLPMGLVDPNELGTRVHHDFDVIARLAPHATIQRAQTEMTMLEQRQAQVHPETNRNFMVNIVPLRDPESVRIRGALLALFAAVGMVLLIACANLANLLLARNGARQREIAVRIALGATPMRMMQQLLVESMVLSLMGGALGLVVAGAALIVLKDLAPPELANIQSVGLDLWALTFTFVLSVLVGVVSGSLPARNSLRTDVNMSLKEGAKASSPSHGWVRDSLVVAEISLALVPLAGAGLLIRSFGRLLEVDPGFRADHLLTMQVSLPGLPQDQLSKMTLPQLRALEQKQSTEWEQLGSRIRGLPGVASVAGISVLPIATEERAASRFVIEGRPETEKAPRPVAEMRAVTPEYFSTMGIRLVQGRLLTPTDPQLPNTIISEKMARQFWPGGGAIGHRVNLCSLSSQPCWSSIVGVVSDVHQFGLNASLTFDMYFIGGWTDTLVIRTSVDPASLVPSVREQIHLFDPALPISHILTMDQILSDSLSQERFSTLLLGIFAALGLLLSAVGVYGVLSYAVGERTNEIGVRVALGARRLDVIGLVVGHGAKLAVIGIMIGVCGALVLTRLLSSLLYGVSATDPLTFVAVAVTLLAVALLACWIPAWRAMRVDPMVALRHE